MSTLEFAIDVVVRGSVLGADHTSSPEDVTRILGATPAENRSRGQPWRDHGLIDCLNALPITLDQAQVPCALRADDLPVMRASRQAKNLIGTAARHLPDLHDHALAEQPRTWIAAKPGLA